MVRHYLYYLIVCVFGTNLGEIKGVALHVRKHASLLLKMFVYYIRYTYNELQVYKLLSVVLVNRNFSFDLNLA